jgi:hypothetical protein
MREHQIVINLKPDQFEEVQRMARAAGSKSVGLFVRQKLIATLGLGTIRTGSAGDDPEAPDLKQLTSELRRLHRELQIFVADSLSNSDYATPMEISIPFPTAVQENFLAEGAPLMPESMELRYLPENISIPFSEAQPPYSIPQAPPENMQGRPAFSIPPEQATPAYSVPQAPPDPTQAQPAYSVPQAPPDPNQAAYSVQQVTPEKTQGFAEDDELEDLAERAFAISPRLGQLDEAVKRFPDPLKDLLEDALINGVDDDDEYSDVEEDEPTVELPVEELSDVEKLEPSEPDTEQHPEAADEAPVNDDLEPETPTVAEEVAQEEGQSDETPPQIPPPISGGPPPRKRPT